MADDRPDPSCAQLALKPLHALPPEQRQGRGVRAPQGRPRKIAPTPEPNAYAVALDVLRQEAIATDPLVAGDNVDVLHQAIVELAREAAALDHERRRLERLGRDAAQVSSRRVDALVRIGALVVERHRQHPPALDVRGAEMQRLVRFFHEMMAECARETLGPQVAEQFLANYAARVAGWEDRIDPPRK